MPPLFRLMFALLLRCSRHHLRLSDATSPRHRRRRFRHYRLSILNITPRLYVTPLEFCREDKRPGEAATWVYATAIRFRRQDIDYFAAFFD